MPDIGRKIYYELSTVNVILDTGERTGNVVETTEAQDFQFYTALQKYQQSAVGVLQLTYGQDITNFGKYPYHIDISTSPASIVWVTTATGLADAQTQKIAQLRDMYSQTLAAGFNVTIGSTQYTFGWASDDVTNMTATQQAVTQGFLSFPIQYADVNGSPVSISDQTTLNSIESTATKFMTAQHQQVLKLITQVNQLASTSGTTVDQINSVQWTVATY